MIIFPLFFFLARAAAHNKVLSDLQSVRVNDGVDAPPFLLPSPPPVLVLSDAQRGRVFEGVGGISGGGATSRLLEDYPDAKVSALYDALFSPQAAAAFQVVKVEIPADSDTTCGSEQAHRHDKADGGSCTRGYEGSFLAAANARRPGIAAHSLQWAAPAFVGEVDVDGGKSLFTRTNAVDYVLPWLECMRESYNVTIAWQGAGWNEKPHNNTYARLLRNVLDTNNFSSTGLASADQCCGAQWNIVCVCVFFFFARNMFAGATRVFSCPPPPSKLFPHSLAPQGEHCCRPYPARRNRRHNRALWRLPE